MKNTNLNIAITDSALKKLNFTKHSDESWVYSKFIPKKGTLEVWRNPAGNWFCKKSTSRQSQTVQTLNEIEELLIHLKYGIKVRITKN
ncbi:MAG: hypothetical protein ACXVC6_11490 [Bacteroidia bacterium]